MPKVEIPDMGKNRRAAKAARAAAAAASTPAPPTTSPAAQLTTAIASTNALGTSNVNELAPATTQQQHDVHMQNTRPVPHASSDASHTTPGSSNGASAWRTSAPAPSATAYEPEGQPVAQPRGTCEVQRAGVHPAPQPASAASHTRSATSPNVSTAPSRTTRASATDNEPDGLVGACGDDVHRARASREPPTTSPASPTHTMIPHHTPISAHNKTVPPMPGFEPEKPRTAAAPKLNDEPELLDPVHVDEIVATALWKGYDAGLKEGQNTGFREGLQAGRKTGIASGKELGYEEGKAAGLKEGREQGQLEVSTTVRVMSAIQTDVVPLPYPVLATSHTDHASAVPRRASEPTSAPADSATPSPCLIMTLDAVDPWLLQDVRSGSYDRGYDAGYHDGASDTFENLEWHLDE